MNPTENRRLVGIKQIADYLNRCERTIYAWIRHRNLPVYKIGGIYEADSKELRTWAHCSPMPDLRLGTISQTSQVDHNAPQV